jgi:hypothetical protein
LKSNLFVVVSVSLGNTERIIMGRKLISREDFLAELKKHQKRFYRSVKHGNVFRRIASGSGFLKENANVFSIVIKEDLKKKSFTYLKLKIEEDAPEKYCWKKVKKKVSKSFK